MKLTRSWRIVIELLGPPLFGAIVIVFLLAAEPFFEGRSSESLMRWTPIEALNAFASIVAVSYVFSGIQSIVFTTIMEWRFSKGMNPRSWHSIGLSTLLGLGSGAAIVAVLGGASGGNISGYLFLGGIGALVGLAVGSLIKVMSPRSMHVPPSV